MLLSRIRRILFWFFTLGFALTASLLIFHALGYRYSFERGIFIYSGSITISSLPQTIDIALDGKTIPKSRYGILNNTYHLAGLMPGEHLLTLSANGYYPWSKRVIIRSGISTEFWNVILIPKDILPETLPDTSDTLRLYPSPQTNIFALAKERDGESSIVIYDRSQKIGREVFSKNNAHFDLQSTENIEWSPDGESLILPLSEPSGQTIYLVNTITGKSDQLSDLTPGLSPQHTRWNAKREKEILFLADHTLYRLTFDGNDRSKALPMAIATDTTAYDITDRFLYVLHGETHALSRFPKESTERTETTLSSTLNIDTTLEYELDVYDDERFALLEKSGNQRLFAFSQGMDRVNTFATVASDIHQFQFSNDGKKLLFSGDHEIGVYFLHAWEVQPSRAAGETLQIGRFSDPIENVHWTEDYEHIIFTQNSIIKIAELDGRSGRIITDLLTFSGPPTQVLPLFEENKTFVAIPNQDITSFTFPEPQRFFGQ